jgi:nucleoside-diphosphate kinase
MEYYEQTLVVIKPDGVRRGLVGEILARLERVGLKIVGMKMTWVDAQFVGKHYKDDAKWYKSVGDRMIAFSKEHNRSPKDSLGTDDPIEIGKKVRQWLLDYLTEGPVVAMVLEGYHAVDIVRKIVGPTYPMSAPPGTIRGDYHFDSPFLANFVGKRSVKNMIHASGSAEEAVAEIDLWFKKNELHDYKRIDVED